MMNRSFTDGHDFHEKSWKSKVSFCVSNAFKHTSVDVIVFLSSTAVFLFEALSGKPLGDGQPYKHQVSLGTKHPTTVLQE